MTMSFFLKAICVIIQEILSIHMHLGLLAETDLNTMHNKYNHNFYIKITVVLFVMHHLARVTVNAWKQ